MFKNMYMCMYVCMYICMYIYTNILVTKNNNIYKYNVYFYRTLHFYEICGKKICKKSKGLKNTIGFFMTIGSKMYFFFWIL